MVYLVTIPSPYACTGFSDVTTGTPSYMSATTDNEPSLIYNPHFASASNDNLPEVNDRHSQSPKSQEHLDADSDQLYHLVTPDPKQYMALTHIETKEIYYFLKLGRGSEYDLEDAGHQNPACSIVVGDKPPAEDGIERSILNEWYKVILKSQDQLAQEHDEEQDSDESEAPEAWTVEQLRLNLIAQQEALENQEEDEYEQLMERMLEMCIIRQETDVVRE